MTEDAPDQPTVPIVCPACETTTRIDLGDVADALDRHNGHFHDGEDVASVDPDLADAIADLVAADLGLYDE